MIIQGEPWSESDCGSKSWDAGHHHHHHHHHHNCEADGDASVVIELVILIGDFNHYNDGDYDYVHSLQSQYCNTADLISLWHPSSHNLPSLKQLKWQ